jgi:hypothetical protein
MSRDRRRSAVERFRHLGGSLLALAAFAVLAHADDAPGRTAATAANRAPSGRGQATRHDAAELDVEVSPTGLVSIDVREAELRDVLNGLATIAGLSIRSSEPLDDRITIAFDRLPVAAAVSRLLHGHRFALLYRGPWAGALEESPNRLSIFSAEGAAPAPERPVYEGEQLQIEPQVTISDDPLARIDAMIALAASDEALAAAELTRIALSDPDDAVREEAVYALGEMRSAESRVALVHALCDAAEDVREAALIASADAGAERAAEGC